MNEISTSIKKMIASGKTDKALVLVENYLSNINHDLHGEVIILSGRFNTLKKKERLGLGINKEEINSISFALLEIADQIDLNTKDSEELNNLVTIAENTYSSFQKKRIKNISLAGGGAISIGVLLFFLGVNTVLLSVISTALIIVIYLLLES